VEIFGDFNSNKSIHGVFLSYLSNPAKKHCKLQNINLAISIEFPKNKEAFNC
jgi:hypothetical protein